MKKSKTPSQIIWSRFKRRKSALYSLFTIVFLVFLSVFANFLVYDHTPDADLQDPTLSLKNPGFTTSTLRIPIINKVESSLFDKLSVGYSMPYKEVAYLTVQSESDFKITIINHYGAIKQYDKSDLLPGQHKRTYYLGTDRYGRSISSRIIRGIRLSLFVGSIAVFISLTLGITLGLFAGYYKGWVDRFIMYLINVTWSIPTLLLVFAIVLAFGRGVGIIFLAVGLTMWVDVARIVRGQVIQLRDDQYVVAAQSLGIPSVSIMFKHILPNIVGPILVIAAANFATAILVEAGLSYLGFGINPPAPSIGNMLNDHYGYAVSGKLFLAIVPAVVIMILVLSFNLVGAGLRDAFDVKAD